MSAREGRAKVGRATKELIQSWHRTKAVWRDAKAAEFEKKYLATLPDQINAVSTIMEELDKLLDRIKKDCE